jgi:hypothetical protein
LLHAYGYLMATANSIGAEQALCRAFHSVVCFSRRETLAYANYSFAGEALFRLYRLALAALPPDDVAQPRHRGQHPASVYRDSMSSHDGDHDGESIVDADVFDPEDAYDWTASSSSSSSSSAADQMYSSLPHQQLYSRAFPALASCRREVIDDLDHYGMAIDPSLCDYGRKNETELRETDRLTVDERLSLTGRLEAAMVADLEQSRRWYSASVVTLAAIGAYATIALTVRCVCVTCAAAAANGRRARCCRHRMKHYAGAGDQHSGTTFHDGPMIGTVDGRHQQHSGSFGCRRKRGTEDIITDRKWSSLSSENWRDDVVIAAASAAAATTGNGLSSVDGFCSTDATNLTIDPRRTRHRVVAAAAAAAVAMETVKSSGNGSAVRPGGDLVEGCRSTSYGDFAVAAAALSAAAAAGNDSTMGDMHQQMVNVNGPVTTPIDYCDHHRVFVSRH